MYIPFGLIVKFKLLSLNQSVILTLCQFTAITYNLHLLCCYVLSILSLNYFVRMPVALSCYLIRFSFSFKVSIFSLCPSNFVRHLACLSLEISIQLFFFPFLRLATFVLMILVLSVFFLAFVISLSPEGCFYLIFSLTHHRYFHSWRVLFLLLFLTHLVSLRHLCIIIIFTHLNVNIFCRMVSLMTVHIL